MPVIQFIEIDSSLQELGTKRGHARAMEAALRGAAHKHVDTRLGKHFKDVPETRPGGAYGYEKRSDRYEKSSRKRGKPPLVKTGKLRNTIGNDTRARRGITATQYRARIVLKAYFPLVEQRRKELEAISDSERREIAQDVRDEYARQINLPENRRKQRRRI